MKGKLMASIASVIMCVFLMFDVVNNSQINILFLAACLLIPLMSWAFGMHHDRLFQKYEKVKQEKLNIENEKTVITQKFEEYEQYFNSFDGAILFIYDSILQKTKFSIGVEQLFGFSQYEFNQNPELWKSIIYPEDIERVKTAEINLYKGSPIQVEFRISHPEQGEKWVLQIAKPHTSDKGELTKFNGTFIDITKQKALESELRHMAYFDELTDLPNRQMLDQHIKKALARSKRHQHNLTLMFIDLDDFKIVNDTLGHDAGDKLLQEVVSRLNQSTREEDLIARLGGDEFIVVFEETSKEEIEEIAARIIKNATRPFYIEDNEAKISMSIGISMYPNDGHDKETLIQAADKAMYFAKNNGKKQL